MKTLLFFFCIVMVRLGCFAKDPAPGLYNIKGQGRYRPEKCESYNRVYKKLPADFRYTVEVFDGTIYFIFPSYEYYRRLFNNRTDGIAVDIVSRDQYDCAAKEGFTTTGAFKGTLMPPMYRRKMMQNTTMNDYGYVYVEYAGLPDSVDLQHAELNLVVLQKKYVCSYHAFSSLDFDDWELLKPELLGDSVSELARQNRFRELSKNLQFVIPFEKDQTSFDASDIKPLYDSLQLTEYDIRSMTIRAYASVEGSYERNLRLQEGRANSIVAALQSYQRPEIRSEVFTNENWVEFYNDITGTKFSHLTRRSQDEIKEKLATDADLLSSLEPVLKNHRKALVDLQLIKKEVEDEDRPETLRRHFTEALQFGKLTEAMYLQQLAFTKIRNGLLAEDFLTGLAIPAQVEFAPLRHNNILFRYERGVSSIEETMVSLQKLLKEQPDNLRIAGNLAALTLESWARDAMPESPAALGSFIVGLEKKGLPKAHSRRLLVNYEILMTEQHDLAQDAKARSKSLREVYNSSKYLNLDDEARVSLAKFLSFYSQFGWAENLLYPRIRQIDASEDLLFYYLQLTISNRRKTRQTQYKSLLLNALDKNASRFCDTFLSRSNGGLTFQLLDDPNLRMIYCDNCSSEMP